MRDFTSDDVYHDGMRQTFQVPDLGGLSPTLHDQHIDHIVRNVAQNATSMIDVGVARNPVMEQFDWIRERISVDLSPSAAFEVEMGIDSNLLQIDFNRSFDLCSCLGVLEHVTDPKPFAQKLLSLGKLLIVSVPFTWDEDPRQDHISYEELTGWMGRESTFHMVVTEPLGSDADDHLIAVYDARPKAERGTAAVVHQFPVPAGTA